MGLAKGVGIAARNNEATEALSETCQSHGLAEEVCSASLKGLVDDRILLDTCEDDDGDVLSPWEVAEKLTRDNAILIWHDGVKENGIRG